MKPLIYPYKMGSNSAKELANLLGCKRIFPDRLFRNNYKRPIINWGNTTTPAWMTKWADQVILNKPECVYVAANKLLTFEKFVEAGVKHPEWTTEEIVAAEWLEEVDIIARLTLTGKGGDGIVLLKTTDFTIPAPLYTKYFKKRYEYRVHVFNGKVIDFVQKKQRQGQPANFQVRNAVNGWVFCREGVVLPECVAEQAIKAADALGLTFGAVDVGFNEKKQEPCVFEVNTAPGLEGTTLHSYEKAIKDYLNG